MEGDLDTLIYKRYDFFICETLFYVKYECFYAWVVKLNSKFHICINLSDRIWPLLSMYESHKLKLTISGKLPVVCSTLYIISDVNGYPNICLPNHRISTRFLNHIPDVFC